MKIDDAIDKLNAAYKRLEHDQGRIARRNARRAYLYALKCLRKGLDDEFPHIRKPVTNRKAPDPKRAVRGKQIISQQGHRQLLAAGVSPSQFVERGNAGGLSHKIYAPSWMAEAWYADIDPKSIAAAVKSRSRRRRIIALMRLGRTKKQNPKKP